MSGRPNVSRAVDDPGVMASAHEKRGQSGKQSPVAIRPVARSADSGDSVDSLDTPPRAPAATVKEEIVVVDDGSLGTSGAETPVRGRLEDGCGGWQTPSQTPSPVSGANCAMSTSTTTNVGMEDCQPAGYTRTEFYYNLVKALTGTRERVSGAGTSNAAVAYGTNSSPSIPK